ncbi:TetR/AcrR family transcriptional regulator [Dactylosporangium sp. NPDC005572]|uniref:TetR/AcrR family transcriptional regulator n=1 Tax=Dactylosporangium sp. NPDC005572 TaxID=3156889 RepID=UPI0033AE190C
MAEARTAGELNDDTRRRIIGGAAACFRRFGIAKTTIDDVASEVRLSRRTVYRYFANKNELFSAVVSQDFEDLSREGRRIYETHEFGEGLVEVSLVMMHRVSESPALAWLFAADTKDETFETLFGGPAFTSLVERFLAPYIKKAQERQELRTDISVADAVEWITHLMFSLLVPNPMITRHDDDHLRALLRTFVLPGLAPVSRRRSRRAAN